MRCAASGTGATRAFLGCVYKDTVRNTHVIPGRDIIPRLVRSLLAIIYGPIGVYAKPVQFTIEVPAYATSGSVLAVVPGVSPPIHRMQAEIRQEGPKVVPSLLQCSWPLQGRGHLPPPHQKMGRPPTAPPKRSRYKREPRSGGPTGPAMDQAFRDTPPLRNGRVCPSPP